MVPASPAPNTMTLTPASVPAFRGAVRAAYSTCRAAAIVGSAMSVRPGDGLHRIPLSADQQAVQQHQRHQHHDASRGHA